MTARRSRSREELGNATFGIARRPAGLPGEDAASPVEHLYALSDATRQKARRTVAAGAQDRDDCTLLLAMLGLAAA
jgi:hypothetical protein